jgi:serine/threonine protein kinase
MTERLVGTMADTTAADSTLNLALFEPYEIVKPLGEGTYAKVYEARNKGVRQRFAIKVLRRQFALSQIERRAFLDEAERLMDISRDRVISARHVDSRGEVPWFVMDFADGNLDGWVRDIKASPRFDGFSLEQLVGLGVELCECLSALHDYDVVHYDLKPHNVLIRRLGDAVDQRRGGRYHLPPDQRLLLGDLGFARTRGELREAVGGSPQYVAPETLVGQGSEQSDIFALGVMLYEFAHPGTQEGPVRPYPGRLASSDPRQRHILADVSVWGPYQPLCDVQPDLPAGFDAVVERAVAPEPSDRYGNAVEVRQALESLLRRSTARPVSRKVDTLVQRVDTVLTTIADMIMGLPEVSRDVYQPVDEASKRLHRRPQIAVLSDGGADASKFTLFLAGEPIEAHAPVPYGDVISYLQEGSPERATVERQGRERIRVPLERHRRALRAELEAEGARTLTLELDLPALGEVNLVDVPMAAVPRHQVIQEVSLADIVVVLVADLEAATAKLAELRQAAQRSPAGPCVLIAVNAAAHEFGAGSDDATRAIEDLGFHQALPQANAGLTLRVYFQHMFDEATGKYIAASAALALCERACALTNEWSIAKAFIDGRDQLESEFPELRDFRYLREDVRGDFELPSVYARDLRQTLSQPTPAGKLDLPSNEADVATVRRLADDRLYKWMTALADGTIPPESADAARVVVANLRRLQDAQEV